MTVVRRGAVRRMGAAILVIAALAAIAGGLLRTHLDTSLGAFLPSNDPSVSGLQQKSNDFGGDPIVALLETSTPRALFTDPGNLLHLLELEGKLSKLANVAAVYGPATVLNQTAGAAQNMLATLMGRRDGYQQLAVAQARNAGMSASQAAQVGRDALAAFDRRYAPLLVAAMPTGLPTLSNARFVSAVLFDKSGNPRPRWKFLVPTPTSVAVLVRPGANLDQSAANTLASQVRSLVAASGLKFSKVTVTGVPAVEAALTDRVGSEAPILGGISLLVVGLVFSASPWSRRRRSRLRPVAAALIGSAATVALFGWMGHRLSFGVIAFLPILVGIGSDFPLYLSRGGRDRRVLAAALAAVVGFGSLAISPLPFVRELGISLALGLTLTIAAAFVLRRFLGPVQEPVQPEGHVMAAVGSRSVRIAASVMCLVAAVAGWVALPHLSVEADPYRLAGGLPELDAAAYASSMLHTTGEVTVFIRGANLASPSVLAWERKVESAMVRGQGDTVHPVITLPDLLEFLGDSPTAGEVTAGLGLMPTYLTSAVLRNDQREGVMAFGVEFADVRDLGPVIHAFQRAIAQPPAGVSASIVGIPVSANRGLDLVSSDRVWINLAGMLGAIVALLLVLRRRGDGARAALTVLLATGWVTLIAWVTIGALSPLTVAVGSLTTATACEFAIMLGRRGSVRPVLTAAVAGTLGYATLAFSELSILREFGALLAVGVCCSFVAAVAVHRLMLPERPEPLAAPDARRPQPQEVLV